MQGMSKPGKARKHQDCSIDVLFCVQFWRYVHRLADNDFCQTAAGPLQDSVDQEDNDHCIFNLDQS